MGSINRAIKRLELKLLARAISSTNYGSQGLISYFCELVGTVMSLAKFYASLVIVRDVGAITQQGNVETVQYINLSVQTRYGDATMCRRT